MTNKINRYRSKFDYSYTSGAYPTIELIKTRPDVIRTVYIHKAYQDDDRLAALCESKNILCVYSDKVFKRLNQKENSYVLGVFNKYTDTLASHQPHIVLVNPSDMGNLGTIIRTIAGLGIKNLALIEPAADIWNPKTIRASMGALFHITHECFNSFDAYAARFQDHKLFPFLLDGGVLLDDCPPCSQFSLVFGNESEGLDEYFMHVGQSVKIPQSSCVDSFNLAVAVGIGTYVFVRKNEIQ